MRPRSSQNRSADAATPVRVDSSPIVSDADGLPSTADVSVAAMFGKVMRHALDFKSA
jgi:hypothetical protein